MLAFAKGERKLAFGELPLPPRRLLSRQWVCHSPLSLSYLAFPNARSGEREDKV